MCHQHLPLSSQTGLVRLGFSPELEPSTGRVNAAVKSTGRPTKTVLPQPLHPLLLYLVRVCLDRQGCFHREHFEEEGQLAIKGVFDLWA